jgi:cytochrome c oxidase subunit 2
MLRGLVLAAFAAALAAPASPRVVHVSAHRFAFEPSTIELTVGVPVILEVRALDRKHGFAVPELGIDAVVVPGHPQRLRVVPGRVGSFAFHCSVFCGSGHDDMAGTLVVTAPKV